MNKFLYIGLNGYAGAGKDTVAKMLYVILNYNWERKEDAYDMFRTKYSTNVRPYATLHNPNDNMCTCIAFADRLKQICADMFGIPIEYFYYNKGTAWICINKDFEYTENEPMADFIITAEDYYTCKDNYINSTYKYYMSLREVLVYVGTYVCQYSICRNVFINSVGNTIKNHNFKDTLKYIICTDVRFVHEYDFIKKENGIMINIVRSSIEQAQDIAEHEMDMIDPENYHYIIYNDGTYEDLFNEVWRITHETMEFENNIIELPSRTSQSNAYLRQVGTNEYKLCLTSETNQVSYSFGRIISVDPVGGPQLVVGQDIFENYPNRGSLIISEIEFDDTKSEYLIYTE